MKRRGVKRLGACLVAAMVAMCVALAAIVPTSARADEADVRAVGESVFKFNWRYNEQEYTRGSCFLINDNYVLTCWHCAMFSSAELESLAMQDVNVRDLVNRFDYTVTIYRDVQKQATLVNYSEEEDWAIFKLKSSIGKSKPVTFRDSRDVKAAEEVYSIGYPAATDFMQTINTYRPDDVSIKRGTVTKGETSYQTILEGGWLYNGYWIQTTCPLSGGDSGGPMVDANGYVIGISESGFDNSYFAIADHSILATLDGLNIEYQMQSGYELDKSALNAAIESAESLKSDDYTSESYSAMTASLDAAREAQGLELSGGASESEYKETQAKIDSAAEALAAAVGELKPVGESGTESQTEQVESPEVTKVTPAPAASQSNTGIIVAGVAAAAILIALVAALLTRKKQPAVVVKPPERAAPPTVVSVPPEVIVNGGTLTRMSTNETIAINRPEYTVGRDRRIVNYYIGDNGAVGRLHARFIVRGGWTYLVDNNSTNGTRVNNAKLQPGVEQVLKSGDMISFADEKFRYNK